MLLLIICIIVLSVDTTPTTVVDLNQYSYRNLISEYEYAFVYFYSPYVVHHSNINKEFQKLIQHFPHDHTYVNIGFGRVQCLIEYSLCADLNIDAFPVFIFHSSKPPLIYNNARRVQSMTKFILNKISNDLQIIGPNSDIVESAFTFSHRHALIGYHLSQTNIDILQNVLHLHEYDVQFAIFDDASNTLPNNDQTLVFYKSGEEWLSITQHDQNNIFSTRSINKLIEYGLLPNVEELTPQNYVQYIHSDVPILWLWVDMDHKSVNNPIFSILQDLMSYRRISKLEPFGCVYFDAHKFRVHMTLFDLDETKAFPQALFIYDARKYHYTNNNDNDFSFDKLLAFIESIMDTNHHEKLNKNIRFGTRSLPSIYGNPLNAPIDSAEDAVYAINTEYHDHIVYNPDIAVVVQYYARWSERCKEFARDYRKLGLEFYNESDVLITKLNIIHNDPPFYISQLPQIVLYYKGAGDQYIVYNGILHSTPIIEWTNQHKHYIEHTTKHQKLEFD